MDKMTQASAKVMAMRNVNHEIIKIAAECARREPIAAMYELTEATHIGHRQFANAFDKLDAAIVGLAVRLKAVAEMLTSAAALPDVPTEPEAELYRWLRDTTHPDNLRKLFNGCPLSAPSEHDNVSGCRIHGDEIPAGPQAAQQAPLEHLRAVVSQYNLMHDWRMRNECEEPDPQAEQKEALHRAALSISMLEATQFLSGLEG